eukprot:scaffold21479_cov57-Phaeocystis_antarctica.AAC.3
MSPANHPLAGSLPWNQSPAAAMGAELLALKYIVHRATRAPLVVVRVGVLFILGEERLAFCSGALGSTADHLQW